MPGIVGFYALNIDPENLLSQMIRSVFHRDDYKVYKFIDIKEGLGVALVAPDCFSLGNQPFFSEDKKKLIIFDGELYNNPTQDPDAFYVLQSYIQKGESFINDLRGVFNFVIIDLQKKRLQLFSDKFDLKHLYYATIQEGFLFASEIKAILCHSKVSRAINPQAFADFYHFGNILGNKSLFRDIYLLPPASILTYDLAKKSVHITKYWDPCSLFSEKGCYDGNIKDIDLIERFINAVKIRLKNKEKLGISLSGGLDSRTILAALRDEARGMPSYTLGLKGCQDEIFSAQIARISGTKHIFLPIILHRFKNRIENLVRDIIFYSDGLYLPYECTEKIALDYFKIAPFKILFRGHGGEIAKALFLYPVAITSEVFRLKNYNCIDFLFTKGNLVIRDKNPQSLFTSSFYSLIRGAARISIEESLKYVINFLHPVDIINYFFIFEYLRRQAVASLNIFRTQVEIRLPFMDEDFLNLLLKLPIKRRYTGEIHVKIIKHCMPALIKVPNSNTGAPLDAGKLRLFLTEKFNSLMKRLSLPGFRHYTEFNKWQRRYFKESIEKIIFDKRTLDRDIYRPEGLREVFEAHISGKKNYAHLLGTVVGLELWFREFVD